MSSQPTPAMSRPSTSLLNRFLREGKRYLWTDALAVRALVNLGDTKRASALVNRVHDDLGRFRSDDPKGRGGKFLGLRSTTGSYDLTAGLRIGKPNPETGASTTYDPDFEYQRDGQYLHYNLQWARSLLALHDASKDQTKRLSLLTNAFQLVDATNGALQHFFMPNGAKQRLFWKKTCDLSTPMGTSSGQHDALNAYVVALMIQARLNLLPIDVLVRCLSHAAVLCNSK
jgi:hypothetical protein